MIALNAYHAAMPAYEFRCRQCGSTFIVNRPMSESGNAAQCPGGHNDTVRLLTVAAAGPSKQSESPAPRAGGGCCGGGCGCG